MFYIIKANIKYQINLNTYRQKSFKCHLKVVKSHKAIACATVRSVKLILLLTTTL